MVSISAIFKKSWEVKWEGKKAMCHIREAEQIVSSRAFGTLQIPYLEAVLSAFPQLRKEDSWTLEVTSPQFFLLW